ncbi:MAG TPA: sugar phosphate isomerase/epimerase family protein [Clostridia bacterium]|nr:sugar phosphate isomerase/epimerase family protein [Clostridia bacterium]
MKKGINVWSFPADLTIEQRIRLAKKAGFDGIELALNLTGPLSLESDEAEIKGYRALADEIGIELISLASGLYWDFPFSADDPSVRAKAHEIASFQLKAARLLGVGCILVVPGCVGADFIKGAKVVPYETVYNRALEAMKALVPVAEAQGVVVGVENVWNKFLLSPLEMRRFIDEVGSPWVQAYLDVGNILAVGYPEHWIPVLGKRIARVHCKDFKVSVGNINGFCDLLAGDVNFPAVVEELQKVGYEGYITAEMGGYRHYSDQIVYNTSASMDRFLGRA